MSFSVKKIVILFHPRVLWYVHLFTDNTSILRTDGRTNRNGKTISHCAC